MDSLYAFKWKRFRNTRQTVTFGILISREACRVDFRGLRTKLSLSCSTVTSKTRGRPGDFATAGALAVTVFGTIVPRASNLQYFATL
jgi:hypothetical protein